MADEDILNSDSSSLSKRVPHIPSKNILVRLGIVKTPLQALYVWSGIAVLGVMYTGHIILLNIPKATLTPTEYTQRATQSQVNALQHLAPATPKP